MSTAGPTLQVPTSAHRSQESFERDLQSRLDEFVRERTRILREVDRSLSTLAEVACASVTGGKRIRASLCFWAWRAAGRPHTAEVVDAAAALELFHAGALVHDDIMDRSHERRGRASAHRRFARVFREADLVGDPERFGDSAAILLGDLLMSWSAEMLGGCGAEPAAVRGARKVFDLMRTQVMGGQYLDIWEQVHPEVRYVEAQRIVLFKSAKYSAEQPLLLGATLGGGSPALIEGLASFGREVGEAFQLRDDILGVFGDPAVTGKPVGDDLRDRKKTVMMALAHGRATPLQRKRTEHCLGLLDPGEADLDFLRDVLVATGALATVEDRIVHLHDQAVIGLEELELDHVVRAALTHLACVAAQRAA